MGEARLVIKRTVRKDAGFYHCHAHNKVGSATPVTTALVVTQEPTLPKSDADERGGGGGQWWARVGDKASLRCHVVAAPAPSFRWTVNTNRVILNSHKYFVRSPQLVDGLMEWESVLELRSVVEADFTEYTCTATNTKGTLTTNHTLIPPHPPHTPRRLQVSAVTGASVTLSWSSHNITDLLGYTLKYSPVADPEYKEMEVKGGDRLSVVVGDLRAGVEYYFTLQAHSTQGSSPFTSPPVFLTIPEAEGLASSSRSSSSSIEVVGKGQLQRLPRFVVLLFSLTTAAFLFLNITIAAFCVRRYTTRRRTQGSGNKTAVVVVMEQQNDAIKDNDGSGGEGDISGDIQTSTTSADIQTVDVTRINREAEKSKSTPETTKARDKPQQHQHLSTFISYKDVEGKLDSQKRSSSQQSIDNLSIKSTQSHLIGSYSNTPPLTPSDRHHHHTSLSDLKEFAQNSTPLPPPPPSDKHHTYPNHHYQHHLHHTSLSDFKELTPSHSYLSLTLPWHHRGFNKDDALLSRSASPMSDLEINKSNKVMMSQCSSQARGHYYLLGKSPLTTKCPSSEAKREANLLQEGCHSTKDHQSNKDYQHPHKSNGNREEEHPGRKNYPSKNGKHLYQQEKRERGSKDYQSGGSCVVVLDEVPSEEDTSHSSCDSCSHHVGSRGVKEVDPKNTSNIPDVCLKGPLHYKSILWQQQQQQPDKLLEDAAIISDQQLLAPSLSQPLVEAQVSTQQSQMMLVGPSELYSHQTTRHCSDSSQYSPSSPQYHSSSPKYRPNSPHYRPKLPKYRPNSPQYCQNSPQFQPDSPHYHPNSPKYRPESPQYLPESPQYCPESPHFLNVIDLLTKSFSSGKPTSQVIYQGHPHLQQQLEMKHQQTEGQLTQQQDQDDLQDSLSHSPTQRQQLQQEEDGSTLQVDHHHRLFSHRDLPHLSYKHSLTSIHEEPGEQQQPQQQSNTINQQHTHHNLLQQQHHQPASYPPHHPIPTPHQHYHHRKYYPPPETHPRSEIHLLPYLKNQQQYLNGINSLLENHTLSKTPQHHFPDSHDHHLPENQEMLKVQQHSSSITHQQQLSKGHQQHLSKLHEDHQPKTHQHPPDNHYQHLPESNQQNRERDFKYVSTTNITPYPSAALQCCKPGGLRLYHPSVIIYPSSHPGYCPLCAVASAALCYEERCRYGVTQNI
ncbi:hypothetical protein Pmani_010208 [Petrolisthes manimaculis]|uniref:Uncharacterized protein n=1 Tax=Petrolisthes manimaculis TaxID=1843537 RepID=A0AAE1UGZ7_9EUCA|nr:hypothetical protein Pmani_010208 [Petrolisthes manimaculis]